MAESEEGPTLMDEHFHAHLHRRMEQRGITEEEVRKTVQQGWESGDAKPGTQGRTMVFSYDADWKETHYAEKEGIVYFKVDNDELILLTAVARYGSDFPRHPDQL